MKLTAIVVLACSVSACDNARLLMCRNSDALSTAAMRALWPIPAMSLDAKELAETKAWVSTRRQWVEAQGFDGCTRAAYLKWIVHVERDIPRDERWINRSLEADKIKLPKAQP